MSYGMSDMSTLGKNISAVKGAHCVTLAFDMELHLST